MRYDLFISYSHRDDDQGKVSAFVEHLSAEFSSFAGRPLRPFFDKQSIKTGEEWRTRILAGLRDARFFLACLTPSYIERQFCEWEVNEYLNGEIARGTAGQGVMPIYFVPIPGWDDPGFEERCRAWVRELRERNWIDLRPWFGEGEQALLQADVGSRMTQLNTRLAEQITRAERAAASLGNVEAHNPNFQGRKRELADLRRHFATPDRIGVISAVNGLGGMGKTALATEYAHAYAEEYPGGRWLVRCEGRDDLRERIVSLAPDLNLQFRPTEVSLVQQFVRVMSHLRELAMKSQPHRTLLLLDNVDRPDLLAPDKVAGLNAADWLHVIATTRLSPSDLSSTHKDRAFFDLDHLPTRDALTLIESYQPGGVIHDPAVLACAERIAGKLLGGFTLAVEAAAICLGQRVFEPDGLARQGEIFESFAKSLESQGLAALDSAAADPDVRLRHGEKRLAATLRPTLDRLRDEERLALSIAAALPADAIAAAWVRELVGLVYPELARDAEGHARDPWRALVGRLLGMRLWTTVANDNHEVGSLVVRMHRLLQDLLRADAGEGLTEISGACAALALQRAGPMSVEFVKPQARWELRPLLGMCWKLIADGSSKAATCAANVAMALHAMARHTEAEPLMRRVVEIFEKSLGKDHPNVASALNNLAQLLKATNRLAEAEPLMRRVAEALEKSLGKAHPSVATALNNLASLLQATNRPAEAEPLMRRALEIDEASYGKDHPSVARDLNNLAQLLKATNRLAEAEPLMRRALAIDEASYGTNHPNVARDLNNLALLLLDTNRPAEAEPLMRRALAIDEASYGKDHPNVAIRLNNLAQLLKATNRLAEAEPLMRRMLEIFLKFTASTRHQHPHLMAAANNYIGLLIESGVPQAEAVRRVIDLFSTYGISIGAR